MSENAVNSINPTLCPKCGQALNAIANQTDVVCSCGFGAFGPYVLEANYLRTGLPKWQARLAELEDAINGGLRPDPSVHNVAKVSDKPAAGAYQYLVGGGSILLFAGLAAFVGIMWRYLGVFGQGAVLALITVVLGVLANRLASKVQATATALSTLTVGSWLIDLGWTISRCYSQLNPDSRLLTTLIIPTALSILTAIIFIVGGKKFTNTIWTLVGQLFIPVSVGLTVSSVAINIDKSIGLNNIYLSILALPFTLAILMLLENGVVVSRIFSEVSRVVSIVIFAISTFYFIAFSAKWDSAALTWALHLVALAAFSFTKEKLRSLSAPFFAGAVVLSAGFTGFPIGIRVVFPAVLCILSLFIGKELKFAFPLLVAATSGAWIVFGFAVNQPDELHPYAIGLSALSGFILLVHGWNTKRIEYLAIGSGFLALAIIFTNSHLEITNLEAFTIPMALTFLVGGLLANRIDPKLSSLLWLGPSCAVALLPSASRATQSLQYSTRFNASLIAAIVLLVVGARLRYLGMLLVGLIAVVFLAQNPITSLFNAVQPWIIFTLAGLLLLILGARFEHLRKRAGVAKAWISGSLR